MAVISNLVTQQTPIASGKTGTQVVKLIPGARVFIKAEDTTPAPPVVKMNGTPANLTGWTDLGIVDGLGKLTYTKETKEVRTGMENILRAVYVSQKTGKLEFDLSQLDDVVLENLTGITPSTITPGSIYQYNIGKEDVVTKAILMVLQNKLDGKEMQIYHPGAFINFSIAESGDALVMKGSADLPMFTYGSDVSVIYVHSILR
jgi:hypothetical protein